VLLTLYANPDRFPRIPPEWSRAAEHEQMSGSVGTTSSATKTPLIVAPATGERAFTARPGRTPGRTAGRTQLQQQTAAWDVGRKRPSDAIREMYVSDAE